MKKGNGFIGCTESQGNGCNPSINGNGCVNEENGHGFALGKNCNGAVVEEEHLDESKIYLKLIFTTLMSASQVAVSNAIQKIKSRLVAENKVKEIYFKIYEV